MASASPLFGRAFAVSIVVLVCALMVLPASAVLANHTHSPLASRSSTVAAHPASSVSTPTYQSPSGLSLPFGSSVPSANLGRFSTSVSSLPTGPSVPAASFGSSIRSAGPFGTSATAPTAQSTTPSSLSVANGVASLVKSGAVPGRVAYYPNLNLLTHPITNPSSIVSPTYNVSPAPMGIGDFGLGASAYNLTTSGVQGSLFLAGYNATAGTLYQDTGAYYWDGMSPNSEVTPYQSGVQLNTVLTNVSFPGSDTGVFWTQNVVQFSGNTLQFIDNVWNFSAPGAAMDPGTLYSYNGTLVPYEFYYAFGPVLPLTFPMSLQLYNNASNVNGRTTLTFGYLVTEPTAAYSGIYDTVVFNSSSSPPLLTPQFMVNGQVANPLGLLFDAELVFGGPGGGSNSVINALDGAMTLQYENGSSWMPAPSAYDYGADTGETAIGMSGYWLGSTEYVNQGPSILYGLWNASAGMVAQPGWISVAATVLPSYAFVFVGPDGAGFANLSYAPLLITGTIDWVLPPSIDGDSLYELSAFADAFDPVFGFFAGNVTGGLLPMTYDPGVWDAPIYMNGPAQAFDLASNATGWVSGPYVFNNIEVDVNLTFNHLNDWGFPEFDMFWANNLSNSIYINNVYQGPNSPNGTFGYYSEYPFGWENLPYYGSEIAVWNSSYVNVQNESLDGYSLPIGIVTGGAVSLWNDGYAYAANISSWDASFGVWAANTEVVMQNGLAVFNAVLLTLSDAYAPTVYNLNAYFGAADVVSWGSWDGYYWGLNATYGSDGLYGIATNFTDVYTINATFDSVGVALQGSEYVDVQGVLASNDSVGVEPTDSYGFAIEFVQAFNYSTAVMAFNTTSAEIFDLWAYNGSQGVLLIGFNGSLLQGVYVFNDSYAIAAEYLNSDSIGYVGVGTMPGTFSNGSEGGEILFANSLNLVEIVVNDSQGLIVEYSNATSVNGVFATNGSLGMILEFDTNVTATAISANDSLGLGIFGFEPTTLNVTNVTASAGGLGVEVQSASYVIVTGIVAIGNSYSTTTGVLFWDAYDLTASDVVATGNAVGVNLSASESVFVSNVSALAGGLGVSVTQDSAFVDIVNVTSSDQTSVGVAILHSAYVYVADTNVSDALGIIALNSTAMLFWQTNVSNDSMGFEILGSTEISIYHTNVTSSSVGIILGSSSFAWVLHTNASGTSVAVAAELSQDVYVEYTNISGANGVGVAFLYTNDSWVNNTSATDDANAVVLLGGSSLHVVGVMASSSFLMATPWPYTFVGMGAPDAAIVTIDTNRTSISNVSVTDYPMALWDQGSLDLTVSVFTATGGYFGAMLNGTIYGLFSGLAFSDNGIGLQMNAGAFGNLVTVSQFDNNMGYGVDIENGANNLVFDNSFVNNNGANSTYNPLAIQAFSNSLSNAFNSTAKVGNYWADWHTYVNGVLAPYYISNGAWDYHPLGAPQGMYLVTFNETGLPLGTSWSVTFNGTTETSTGSSIVFDAFPGSYAFAVGAIAGWQISPSGGTVTVATAAVAVPVGFSALYPVQFVESGLPPATVWTVVLNGVEQNVSGSSATFDVTAGTYSYMVLAPAGWAVSPASGSVVVGAAYAVPLTFTSTVPPEYTVTVTETGLASGTSWSVVFNGVEETTTGTTLTFTVPAGTYTYQVLSVAGYTASVSSSSLAVMGDQPLAVTFSAIPPAPTYTVYVNETGLASGTSWSAVFNGIEETTTGSSLAFTVTAGTYVYQVLSVDGYTASVASSTVTISGSQSVAVTFTAVAPPPTYTVYVNETGLPSGTSWSVVFNGVEKSATGASLTFTVGAGTYSYQIVAVDGYSASVTNGSVTISGSQGVSVTFSPTPAPPSTPAYVEKSTFNWEYAVALGIAVVAVLLALLALLRRPRAPAPAVPWREGSADHETSASSPPSGASRP